MRDRNKITFIITLFFLCGCVNLTAVNDFAKESSVISANKAMLDDSDAQTEARKYDSSYPDPNSADFKNRLAVTNRALDALNAYMSVLAQLSANDVSNVSSDFNTIGSELKALNVTDPAVQKGVSATSALVDLLLNSVVRSDIKKLLINSAQPVADITGYLIDQAQTTANTYVQAIAVTNKYWGDLTSQTDRDKEFCKTAHLCETVYVLATRTRDADAAVLAKKNAAAMAAVKAFAKIQSDNAALVKNADHLDAKNLVDLLKADEPDLKTAINNLRAL